MKIESLRFKGFTRFENEVFLDFADVPPGIIAITGANGEGKTTVLEAMFAGFYGVMPSRLDRSLTDLVNNQRDAFIEVTCSFESAGTFLSRVNVDGLRRVTDAILQQTRGNQTQRTDGKVSTHRAAVAKTLPPRETLLASAFAAQNKTGSFSSLDRRGRKDLFSQLLGLERYEQYADTARTAAATLDRRRAELQAQADLLASMTTPEQADALRDEGDRLANELGHTHNRAEAAAERVDYQTGEVGAAQQHMNSFAKERERLASAIERRRHLSAQAEQFTRNRDSSHAQYQQHRKTIVGAGDLALMRIEAARQGLPTDDDLAAEYLRVYYALETAHRKTHEDIDTKVANNESLVARATEVRAAVTTLGTLEVDISVAEEQLAVAEHDCETGMNALTTAQRLKFEYAGWPNRLAEAERDAKTLETVPFGEQCAVRQCQFVKRAAEAKASIPQCEEGLRRFGEASFAVDNVTEQLKTSRESVIERHLRVRNLRNQLQTHQQTRVFAERLDHAEERLRELAAERRAADDHLTAQRVLADAEHLKAQQTRDHDRARLTAEQAEVAERMDLELAEVDAQWAQTDTAFVVRSDQLAYDVAAVEREIAELERVLEAVTAAEAELTKLQQSLALVREEHAQLRAHLAALEAEQKAFKSRRLQFRQHEQEHTRLEAAIDILKTDVIEWQVLARVFGRDGLPVLEIDAAGPQVSELANDLLQSCFSGRFSVELATQEAKADGKGVKEAFDIHVFDSERGGDTRDLSDLSGGEQVVVDEAIKSALALLVNSRNVMPIRTAWRDETAGALDPENAQRYLLMLRRLRERGGFHHLFLIAHNPELTAQADAQIVCKDGTARLVYPPFMEAA